MSYQVQCASGNRALPGDTTGRSLFICDSIQVSDSPEMMPVMESFHETFHEPYYRHYINDDLERLDKSSFRIFRLKFTLCQSI